MPSGLIFKDTHFSSCCRSRLADFFTNCQPESRSVSSCLKENYADCLLAYSGLIGKRAGKGGGLLVRKKPQTAFWRPTWNKNWNMILCDMILGQFLHLHVLALFRLAEILGVSLYITRKLRMEDKERKVLEFEVNSSLKKIKLIKIVECRTEE